jgi:hypothetical protein
VNTPHFPKAFTATVNQLGAPKRYFPVKNLNRVGNLITSLILVGSSVLVFLYGLYVTYLAYQKHGLAMIDDKLTVPVLVAIVMLLPGLAAGWSAYANWRKGAAVFEHGLAVRDHDGIQAWRWEEVVSLTAAVTRHHIIGISTGTTHIYHLLNRKNQRLVLNDTYTKVEELAKIIEDSIFPILYANAVRQYNTRQRLVFGHVAISQAGIQIGKKTFPWTDVKQVSIHQGNLKVSKTGGSWFNAASASASVIPNLNVLLNIISQVVGLKID